MGYSKPAPEGGRWRGAAAPKAAKVDTAPAEVGTAGVRSTAPSGQTAAATTKARAYDAQGAQYDAVVQQAAAQYGVDAKILKRLIASESSFDPNIVNKTSGALGLAQIMPSHINKGLVSAAQARDPATAISFAAAHLAQNLRNEGGDYRKALLKYKGALSPKGTAAMSPVVRDITSGLQWDAQQVLGAVGPQLAQSRDPATNAALALRTNPSASGAPSGVSNGGVQLAGSATQEPVLKLSSLNTYLTKPDKIVPAVADTLSQRDLVKREAEIYASSGNEAAYQQSVAKLQQIDANLIRLQGAQAIIDTQTFLDPSRAEKLISYLSNGELQVQMRADGRFAYFGRNQKGQMVPIPGQDNVSRADFISTLRAATDESYRVRREAADIAAAAAQASFNQDIEKERFKGQIAGELQTQRLGVDAQRALLEAKTRLQIAERNGQNITSIGSGENEMFLQTNPDNPNDPWVFKPGGFETTGPGGTTIVTTDAIPFSQLAGTAQ